MNARSVVAVVLPSFRVALVRARSPDIAPHEPLCVVVDEARGAQRSETLLGGRGGEAPHEERDERSLSGGTRIDEVSDEARANGVFPGTTIASAKAKCSDLRVRVLRPREVTRTLESLAEMLLSFGAITSPLLDRDAVLVDVTGCAHLHGGDDALLASITSAVNRVGFTCHAVLSSGPEIAWALAHAGRRTRVVKREDTMRALGELPIDVLRLEPRTQSYFHKLGVSTLAELRALPRASLTARSGNANLAAHVRALLDGDDDTPMVRFQPEVVLEERAELEYGIEQHEALLFVLKPLGDRLAARLAGRCMLASCLEVVLELDRAMCAGESTVRVSLPLASPIGKSAEIITVLRSRFEREPALRAPVLAVVLRAPELAPVHARPRHLFEPESRAEIALPKLVAELSALLGAHELGTLAIVDDWRPERRSILLSFGSRPPKVKTELVSQLEPIRLAPPQSPKAPLKHLAHLARFDQVGWWRGEPRATVDWKLAWSGGAMIFVEVDGHGQERVRAYLD